VVALARFFFVHVVVAAPVEGGAPVKGNGALATSDRGVGNYSLESWAY
jgi:hypothetical protein